jgi:hypothetical protein
VPHGPRLGIPAEGSHARSDHDEPRWCVSRKIMHRAPAPQKLSAASGGTIRNNASRQLFCCHLPARRWQRTRGGGSLDTARPSAPAAPAPAPAAPQSSVRSGALPRPWLLSACHLHHRRKIQGAGTSPCESRDVRLAPMRPPDSFTSGPGAAVSHLLLTTSVPVWRAGRARTR